MVREGREPQRGLGVGVTVGDGVWVGVSVGVGVPVGVGEGVGVGVASWTSPHLVPSLWYLKDHFLCSTVTRRVYGHHLEPMLSGWYGIGQSVRTLQKTSDFFSVQ